MTLKLFQADSSGIETPSLPEEINLLKQMQLIRSFELKLLQLFSEGKIFGTTHTSIGQESIACGVMEALDLSKDIVFSNHRCHGHFIAYGGDPINLFAEIMGKEEGVCGGRGGSQHLYYKNFYSNGIQGGIVPVAAGMAFAEKSKSSGAISVCFLGDGTFGEGVVYETMNMASLMGLPILFLVENNHYAQSTPTSTTTAGEILSRAKAFGIDSDHRVASDPVSIALHMNTVVSNIRAYSKPFFQVFDTYRLSAHSKGDDTRDISEVESYRLKDPLLEVKKRLGIKIADLVETEAEKIIDNAAKSALDLSFANTVHDDFNQFESDVNLRTPIQDEFDKSDKLVVHSLNDALHEVLDEDENVFLIGEDILDPYGGAFKVTKGLSTKYPGRVLGAPISEAAIVGIGIGASMRGKKPVIEIMFGDFITLAADQIINHLAKFHFM